MSAKPVEYDAGASLDVKRAAAWHRKRSRKAAVDFIEKLQRAAETIREAPDRRPLGKNNTRRFLLWRFPFSIIYSDQESVITIWAVAHGSRRPEDWAAAGEMAIVLSTAAFGRRIALTFGHPARSMET